MKYWVGPGTELARVPSLKLMNVRIFILVWVNTKASVCAQGSIFLTRVFRFSSANFKNPGYLDRVFEKEKVEERKIITGCW